MTARIRRWHYEAGRWSPPLRIKPRSFPARFAPRCDKPETMAQAVAGCLGLTVQQAEQQHPELFNKVRTYDATR